MFKIILRFFEIVIFKVGPQSLPDSAFLVKAIVALNLLVRVTYLFKEKPISSALMFGVISLMVLYGLTKLVLGVRNLSFRFNQTFMALVGNDTINTTVLVVLIFSGYLPSGMHNAGDWQIFLFVSVSLWYLAVQGFILRHSLGVSRITGALLSIWFMSITILVVYPLEQMSFMR